MAVVTPAALLWCRYRRQRVHRVPEGVVKHSNINDLPVSAAIVIDRKGYIVGWNEGATAVLGFAEPDVVGRPCHHVLCGRDPEGRLVCHPWCELSPAMQQDVPEDDLVLYPRTASREILRVVLSAFRVGGADATRGWVVHLVAAAELLPAVSAPESSAGVEWSSRPFARKPKRSEKIRH